MQYLLRWHEEEVRRVAFGVVVALLGVVGIGFLTTGGALVTRHLSVASGASEPVNVPEIPNTGQPANTSSTPAGVARKPTEPIAMVSFDFEGGYESAYTKALPILEKASMQATMRPTVDYIGYSGYINEAQLRWAKKQGVDVEVQGWPERSRYEFTVGSSTTFDEVREAIDGAVKNKQWLIFVFHRIDEDRTHDGKNTSSTLLQKIVSYVQSEGIRTVTEEEGQQILNSQS